MKASVYTLRNSQYLRVGEMDTEGGARGGDTRMTIDTQHGEDCLEKIARRDREGVRIPSYGTTRSTREEGADCGAITPRGRSSGKEGSPPESEKERERE